MNTYTKQYLVLKGIKAFKAYKFLLFVLFTGLFVFSCDFNFPEERNEDSYLSDLEYHFAAGSSGGIITFQAVEWGNSDYQVVVYPQWLEINSPEGKLNNGSAFIPFSFKNPESFMQDGRTEGYIYVRVGDKGIYLFLISYGEEKPEDPIDNGQEYLDVSSVFIDFGFDEYKLFTLHNPGQVGKNWYIEDIPDWLHLSRKEGYLEPGESLTIECNVIRDGMIPGNYSQIINVESDNPQLSTGILVEMMVKDVSEPTNTSSVKWIEGTVKDAYYNKINDYLYILTESPNALLLKTPDMDSIFSYSLDRIPNCIEITDDGKTLAIGYNQSYVDIRDAVTIERIRLYETDCVPSDLVFGENGWIYISPERDQWVSLYSLDLTSGETFKSQSTNFYERSVMRKLPGKQLVYITRAQLYPSGIQIVDIQDGIARDTVPMWHEDTGSNFWFSPDGSKIITGDKEIHPTPEYDTEMYHLDLSKSGTFSIPKNYIYSLDYNNVLHCYFVVGSDYPWGAENAETIFQVNETSYASDKSLTVSSYPRYIYYHPNPAMDVYYVFSNSAGTKLFAVKNIDSSLSMNIWALELFDLPLQ